MTKPPPTFLVSKEYRRFVEFCEACRRYRYIGLCHGPTGVGKTISARQYVRWDLIAPYAADAPLLPPEVATCHTVLYTPPITSTPRQFNYDIADAWEHLNVVVDAARRRTAGRTMPSRQAKTAACVRSAT